jgi:ribosomal protein L35
MSLKTNKAILSRLKITKGGKMLRRPTRQSHFNAKDSGKQGRVKHGSVMIKKSDIKLFKQFLPYHK